MAGSIGQNQNDPLGPELHSPFGPNGVSSEALAANQETVASANAALARSISPSLAPNGAQGSGPALPPDQVTGANPRGFVGTPWISYGQTDPPRGWTAQQGRMPTPSYAPTGREIDYLRDPVGGRYDESSLPVAGIAQNRLNQAPIGGQVLEYGNSPMTDDPAPQTDVSGPAGPPG